MKTFKEFLLEKQIKKPNPYAKVETKVDATAYKKYPAHMTHHINGWETVTTGHANERTQERGEVPGGHHDFMKKVISHVSKVHSPKNGEYLYVSKKHDQGVVINVNHEHKQLRAITVLPKGKHFPKPGTKKIMVEGVEHELEVIMLEDLGPIDMYESFLGAGYTR